MTLGSTLIGLLIGAAATYLILYFYNKKKTVSKDRYDSAKSMFERKSEEFESVLGEIKLKERDIGELSSTMVTRGLKVTELSENLAETDKLIKSLNEDAAGYEAVNRSLMEKLSLQEQELEKLHEASKREFEKAASKILEEKSDKLTEVNKESIRNILDPLGEKLAGFRQAVEDTFDQESKERQSLEGTVKDLLEQANKVSRETSHLTNALKGQSSHKGNWGEVVLERVLENSGLVRDLEYFVRKPIDSEDGRELLPDVTVQLPGERTVIIDSRVPLEAYDKCLEVETDEEREEALTAHLESVKNHINELSEKHYDDLESSLDFTMMFIPIEPAFLLAIQSDPELLANASSERILIISPSNLIAVLKIVADLWTRERQNKTALDILKRGELLYEKFVDFSESMQYIGDQLEKTQAVYDKAIGQLKTGKGNLMGQAIKLRKLGLESKKDIPSEMIPAESTEDLPLRLAAKSKSD